ncbi:hypothetical protein PybrP1_003535 [[Pythium] brassicae (nom. inval.)]|nr:hypothetical protein PybrP1_003535 [[Pythium] brassicae (nom. inval.)]
MRRNANGGRGGAWPQLPPQPPFAPPPHFHPQPPPPQPPPANATASAAARTDVNAFIEALRSRHSQPSAPPSALSVPTAVHAVCAHFQVTSVEELLGVAPLQVPALRQLNALNQRVWTFVTCFVHTRRINTLFECFQAFLAHEGVRDFHELRMGNSFLHTEAVQVLYHAPTAMLSVSTRDILAHLRQFEAILGHDAFRNASHIDRGQFLQYLAQQYRQPNVERLGLAIDPAGFGAYIALLRRLSHQELKEMKAIEQDFQKGIADKLFEVTKDKFSAENRQHALDELLQAHGQPPAATTAATSEQGKTRAAASNSSLSLEMLKRVTDIDVYLDNVLRRKAAAGARANEKPIVSQDIAETDLKIRNQLTRFLVATQKSKHHSRIKVVTWVLCGVMAKIHVLLLHDDKLPDDRARGNAANSADSADADSDTTKSKRQGEDAENDSDDDGDDECACCCVGNDTCKCSCSCECHANSSDEDDNESEVATGDAKAKAVAKPAQSARVSTEPKTLVVDMDTVKREVAQYLTNYCESNEIDSLEQLLMCFISLEIHLQHDRGGRLDRSALEIVLELWNDDVVDKHQAWYQAFDRLIAASSHNSSSSAATDRAEVTKFIQQCYATLSGAAPSPQVPKSDMLQLLAARTRAEFGFDVVEQLGGAESIAALAEEAMQLPSGGGEHGIITYSNALLPPGDLQSDACADAPGESLHSKRVEEAIDALHRSPFLVDVAQWTQWQQRYAPSCGPLRAFVRTHEMILLDHASLMFVFGWNGVVRRVDDASTPSALELLVARASPPPPAADVAVHLVSMLVKCGGQQNYPTQLLQAHLRSLFSIVSKQLSEADDEDNTALGRYVLEILLVVPLEFADFVYSVVADAAASGGEAPRDRLADRFRSHTETSRTAHSTGGLVVVATDRVSAAVDEAASPIASSSATGLSSHETIADRFARPTTVAVAYPESCRACVEQIRKEQFGIGLEVQDEATAAVLAIQQQRLERALKRLSDELYSENTHFVLELLQNADDNEYDRAVRAKGEFTLTADRRVVFYNNERGFSRANIRAICDVGASTKASSQDASSSASIGKKGIGFKSVFKISDSPEVHSNGFHLRFHATTSDAHAPGGGLGYILPFWIDDEAAWQRQRGTTLVLPLNAASVARVDEISASLLAFEPSVLLFLRRIRELRIADHVHNQQLHFLKEATARSSGHQIVQLFSQISRGARVTPADRVVTSHAQEWLVVTKRLVAPAAFAGSDGLVRETELAVALPLAAGADASERAPLQQVFAYLPLRSYGFRFVLQGDFEVPSSREAIVNGSEWNQWLVSQVPALLGQAVARFVDELQHAAGDSAVLPRIAHLLSLLPFESEIQAPFRCVVRDAMREVSRTPFLPVESARGLSPLVPPSASLELGKPVELLDAWDAVQDDEVLQALVRDEPLVAATLKKKLLLFELSKALAPQQKALLRVEKLKAAHVLQLLAHAPARNDAAWVVGMLRVLGRLWKRDQHAALLLQELRLIKCFPLERAASATAWVSLADVGDALFLASAGESESSGGLRTTSASSFYGDLNVLRSDFASAVAALADVRAFLIAHAKLKTVEDHDLIAHYMLPQLARLEGSASDGDAAAALVSRFSRFSRFIASHLVRCSGDCPVRREVQSSLRVRTCAEQLATAATASVFVLLPSAAREMPALSQWLRARVRESGGGARAFDIVAPEALDAAADDGGDASHRKLLVETLNLPLLFDAADERAALAFTHALKWFAAEPSADAREKLSAELAQHLNKHWPSPVDATAEALAAAAAVAGLLRSAKWLRGSDGKFHRPSRLWIPTAALRALLPESLVPYSRVAWPNAHLASAVLRLKQTPTLADALDALVRLARQPREGDALELELSDVRRLYAFAAEQATRDPPAAEQAIREAFSAHALVLAPRREAGGGHAFFAVRDVVWSATACSGHLVALEQSYPKALRPFFTELCGVARRPSVASLCERIAQLATVAHAPDAKKRWRREMLPVLQFFATQARKAALLKPELRRIRKTLKTTAWLPTVSAASRSASDVAWCSSRDAPVVCATDEELEVQTLVTGLRLKCGGAPLDRESIQLVQLDPALLDELAPLVKLAKIRSLAAHVVAHPSGWCDLVADAADAVAPSAPPACRKRVQKLLKRLVGLWSHAFALNRSVWATTDAHFQQTLQHRALFPVLHNDTARFAKAADVYVNDQAELPIDSFGSGLQLAFPILSLFPSGFLVDADPTGDAARVRDFLLSFAGMRSLQALLTWDVTVASAHQRESATLRVQIQQSLNVAQRFLFQQHRALYDTLPHADLERLARDVRCVVVQDAGVLGVSYRIGAAFGVHQSVPSCFLDLKTRTLYVVAADASGDAEWRGRLHDVLLELSRKCFGSTLAAGIANLLYLASLQPSAELREQWLVDSQQLEPLDPEHAGTLWAPPPLLEASKKRALSTLEDGEVEDEDEDQHEERLALQKRVRLGAAPQWRLQGTGAEEGGSAVFPPLPPLPPADDGLQRMRGFHASLLGASGGAGAAPLPVHFNLPPGAHFQPPLPPLPPPLSPSAAQQSYRGADHVVRPATPMSKEERVGIGRWGEEYVYKQLVASHKDNADVTVEWVNEHEESGKPYDIAVSSRGKVVEYVEVKATRTMEKATFEISMNELDQAAIHGSSYCIYRVFNAGNDALCRVVRMKNPIALVRQKKMQLALVMQ